MASDSDSTQPSESALPVKFHLLRIEHKHGENHTLHRSDGGAKDALHDYVRAWWDKDGPGGPIPEGRDEAIHAYFDEHAREAYSIVEIKLED